MQVTVKPPLGEGLLPVIKGEDHVPNKKKQCNLYLVSYFKISIL